LFSVTFMDISKMVDKTRRESGPLSNRHRHSSRRARRPCISHPFLVAAAPPGGLAGNREPRAVRGGVGCHAPLRSPPLSSRERRLGRQDRQAVGNRVDVTGAGEAEERAAGWNLTVRRPTLPKGPKFGGWHLFSFSFITCLPCRITRKPTFSR